MNKQLYPTDMTDSQGEIIQEILPPAKSKGRPRRLDLRQVINAIVYIVVGGIQWPMLPKEYPKWPTLTFYQYFSNKRTERVILRPRAEESPGMWSEKVDNPEILHSAPLRSENDIIVI